MVTFGEHEFWDFSVALYGRPGVGDACVWLQRSRSINVNLLLFCIWWGSAGRRIAANDLSVVSQEATLWHQEVVLPARSARTAAKAGAKTLTDDERDQVYRHLLAAELDCEHAEQLIIARSVGAVVGQQPAPCRPLDAISLNLKTYFHILGSPIDRESSLRLATIIVACLPASVVDSAEIQQTLQRV